jgi:hypothetical protein
VRPELSSSAVAVAVAAEARVAVAGGEHLAVVDAHRVAGSIGTFKAELIDRCGP